MLQSAIPEPVTKLIEAFSRLPGVGPKTASRLTYYLLRAPDELSLDLAAALRDLKTLTRFCGICFNITVDDPCPICASSERDAASIAVVEEPLDLMAIERTGIYRGQISCAAWRDIAGQRRRSGRFEDTRIGAAGGGWRRPKK